MLPPAAIPPVRMIPMSGVHPARADVRNGSHDVPLRLAPLPEIRECNVALGLRRNLDRLVLLALREEEGELRILVLQFFNARPRPSDDSEWATGCMQKASETVRR